MREHNNGRPVPGPDAGGAASQTAAGQVSYFDLLDRLLVNRVDAARLLSISPRKLDEWVAAGLITKWKRDGVVRFNVEELRAFAATEKPKSKRTAGDGRRLRAKVHPARNGVDAHSV
jgi:hypothetical protein